MIRSLLATAIFGVCLLAVGCDTSAGTGAVGPLGTGSAAVQQLKSDKAEKKNATVQIIGGDEQPKK